MSSLLLLLAQLGQAVPGLAPRDELARRIDSLDRAIARISADLKSERDRGPSDTVALGRLRLALDHRDIERLVPVATAIAGDWARLFGDNPPAVSLTVTSNEWDRNRTVSATGVPGGTVVGASVIRSSIRGGMADGALRKVFWEALGGVLLARADTGFVAWLPLAPAGRADVFDPNLLAYQWIGAIGPASVACRAGDESQCRRALGLSGAVTQEFPLEARAAFLAYLLETSPPGGWARLEGSVGRPMSVRLGLVGGGDIGSHVMAWRRLRLEGSQRPWDSPTRWAFAGVWGLVALGIAIKGGMRT